MASKAFEQGASAAIAGLSHSDNPYVVGYTKLGNPKLSEDGVEWQTGFNYAIPRIASAKEVKAARSVDVSRFKRKFNRYYGK